MEILNKRERKLFKLIKKEMKQNNTYTIEGNELHIYNSLLKKLKNSNLVFITYADNCTFIHDYNRLLQFEIEEKELKNKKEKLHLSIIKLQYSVQ